MAPALWRLVKAVTKFVTFVGYQLLRACVTNVEGGER